MRLHFAASLSSRGLGVLIAFNFPVTVYVHKIDVIRDFGSNVFVSAPNTVFSVILVLPDFFNRLHASCGLFHLFYSESFIHFYVLDCTAWHKTLCC